MKLIPFDTNKADHEYKQFYNQSGGGSIPIFAGTKTQIGYGLGGMFGSLLKAALPVIKKGALSLGKTALKTGINIAKDGFSGKTIKKAFSDNIKDASKNLLQDSLTGISGLLSQTGNRQLHRANKRKIQKGKQSISHKRVKRKHQSRAKAPKDIFS